MKHVSLLKSAMNASRSCTYLSGEFGAQLIDDSFHICPLELCKLSCTSPRISPKLSGGRSCMGKAGRKEMKTIGSDL